MNHKRAIIKQLILELLPISWQHQEGDRSLILLCQKMEGNQLKMVFGLWQNCIKMVDNDPTRFTSDLVREWKRLSEHAAVSVAFLLSR